MKIKFLAVAKAPARYSFSGEIVQAYDEGSFVEYDISHFPENGVFTGAENSPSGARAIRGIGRIGGELHIILVQKVIAGQYPGRKAHWRESPIIDAADYDPNTCYVVPTGMAGVDDYEIAQGVDVAGNTGWTVRKKETADG
ncbi:hypothetical protein C6W88_15520 [Halomonas litopenaei]|uniref:Uncharacterized protein n=1 Tax=Halomonas litopenaei TaxID=2109328 RepID=A0ABX5IXG6_9GAMM|nr:MULTISPECIES: hypothetical protein [Halomonas]PTL88875.1 hypothetical protein C6W89_20180 [Halomonas sp. SYSU XM8]PTL93420.1 hypothetical protein C6W88_15520 [Halomonas litopenaei]